MAVVSYEQLEVWQEAMDLVTRVCQQTARFPREEMYGLTSQVRRAAVSIPSNIAEGQGRRSTREFMNHLSIARGSLMEVQTQLEIAARLRLLTPPDHQILQDHTNTVGRLLNGLIRSLDRKTNPRTTNPPT